MTTENRISFRCLEVSQPIGTFYVGVMDAEDLIAISYADVRRIEQRDIERYLGIQRTLSQSRVEDIAAYVSTVDATFPTSIILAVDSKNAEYSAEHGTMVVDRADSVAKIIDGQHRIAGLKKSRARAGFLVNVTIFVDMDIEDQSLVFSTINLEQTKVGRSLAYDLFENTKTRSPQKTLHNAARVLNQTEGSPFFQKIKILGRATPGRKNETITQAAFIEGFLPYLTKNALKDRDALKRKQDLDRALPGDPRILRNMFVDERDKDIVLLIWNFFSGVQRRWPAEWTTKESGNILNRTTGFSALARLFAPAYELYGKPGTVAPPEFFETLFSKVTISGSAFTPDNYPPGGAGTSRLFKELSEQIAAP